MKGIRVTKIEEYLQTKINDLLFFEDYLLRINDELSDFAENNKPLKQHLDLQKALTSAYEANKNAINELAKVRRKVKGF